MTNGRSDNVFSGSIPEFYETYLVPLIFLPYAQDLAHRVASESTSRVLEIASGTGVVTRAMADTLDASTKIIATDLNQPMLDFGASVRNDANVERRQADAMALPFEDGCFDAVVCQFSVMFFPDRPKAYSEVLRVLKPGGRFIFNVWDHIKENEFAHEITESLAALFPDDPPKFLARTPYGYFDVHQIKSDVREAGFVANAESETISARSKASDPSIPSIAFCQGTPLRNEIENRNSSLLQRATDVATAAIAERFGQGSVDGKIQGHVVSVRK
jgi:SAM-dependent methyltransferase